MENLFYTLIAFQNARNHYQAIILRQDFRKMCFGLHIPKYDNSAPDVPPQKKTFEKFKSRKVSVRYSFAEYSIG